MWPFVTIYGYFVHRSILFLRYKWQLAMGPCRVRGDGSYLTFFCLSCFFSHHSKRCKYICFCWIHVTCYSLDKKINTFNEIQEVQFISWSKSFQVMIPGKSNNQFQPSSNPINFIFIRHIVDVCTCTRESLKLESWKRMKGRRNISFTFLTLTECFVLELLSLESYVQRKL